MVPFTGGYPPIFETPGSAVCWSPQLLLENAWTSLLPRTQLLLYPGIRQ